MSMSSPTTTPLEKWQQMTVSDLRKSATRLDVSGRSGLKKSELITLIRKSEQAKNRKLQKMNDATKARYRAKVKVKSKAKAKTRVVNHLQPADPASSSAVTKEIVTIAHHAIRGRRDYMEDTWIANTNHRSGWKIFGVFDGHGGKEISDSLARERGGLAAYLLPKLARSKDIPLTIEESVIAYDKKLAREHGGIKVESGSTGILLVLDPKNTRGWFVNIGDSRAVWYSPNGYIRQKTLDHKPRDPDELKRIRDAGGHTDNSDGTWRVDGILALSRAFGDFHLKIDDNERREYEDGRVSSVPDVVPLELNPMQSDVFVLASDGLWDELNNRNVGAHVKNFGASKASCQVLVQKAYDVGSQDNITVLMVHLDLME